MYPLFKRLIDIVFAVIGLSLLAPAMLIISVLIILDSVGPAIYKETRIGKAGRPFSRYKFRTMYIDKSGITKVGRFLRDASLDELPTLINVVRGEMSLVGPWPALPFEAEHFADWQRERLKTTPGITGLWQISHKEKDFDDMIKLDITYVRNQSLLLDLKIILGTVDVVITESKENESEEKEIIKF